MYKYHQRFVTFYSVCWWS